VTRFLDKIDKSLIKVLMAGLVPAIYVLQWAKTWMPGTRPGMTIEGRRIPAWLPPW